MSIQDEITYRTRHLRDANHIDELIQSVKTAAHDKQQTYTMEDWVVFLRQYAILRDIAGTPSHHKPDFFHHNELNKWGITPDKLSECRHLVAASKELVKSMEDLTQLFADLGSPAFNQDAKNSPRPT